MNCEECDQIAQAEEALHVLSRKNARIASNVRSAGLPATYFAGERTLSHVRSRSAVMIANTVLDGLGRGMFIHGTATGDDKTTLAAAFLVEWIKRDRTGIFVNALDLMSDIHASYNTASGLTRNDIIKPLIEADALVIDDLGKEPMTPHSAAVIYQIFNGRYSALVSGMQVPLIGSEPRRRAVVITSNYSLDRLCARFGGDENAEPIRRRIAELTLNVEMGSA